MRSNSSPISKSKTVGGAPNNTPYEGENISVQKGGSSHQHALLPAKPNDVEQNIELNKDEWTGTVTIISPLKYSSFALILPFFGLFELAVYLKFVFISAYGAAWFGGCRTIKSNDNCDKTFDYDTFNLWNNYTLSGIGLLAFFTSGFVGVLSDFYGRKRFIYFQLFTTIISYVYMIFYDNFYVFFGLSLLTGLNGTSLPTGPVSSAMIADILPNQIVIMGFAYYYILGGFGLGVGSVIGYLTASYVGDHFNFYLIVGSLILCFLYMIPFFPETLPKEKRKPVDYSIFINPFLPLKYFCKNPVVLWMGLLYLFLTLPDNGITNIVIVVFSDAFDSDTQDKSNTIALLYLGGLTVGLIFAPFVVLPLLKYCFVTDYKVLIVTTCILAFSLVFMALVVVVKQLWMVSLVGFSLAHAYLCLTAGSSILAQYTPEKDRGEAFGAVGALNNLSAIVAPTMFAVIYHYLREYNLQFGIYVIAVILVIGALFMVLFPLKRAIARVEGNRSKYGL